MRYGSLFSGIGGFDLGLDRAGMECAWQCEIEPFPVRVLERHWPGVTRYGDIREVDTDAIERVDLICGGFPCQDLSVAGKRAGLAGERSGLFFEFIRIADAVAPKWVLIENVPGLLSSNKGEDFAVVLEHLTGFRPAVPDKWRNSGICTGPKRTAVWRVLDAQYFGVAQRRRRVFIVASAGDGRRAAEVLLEPESGAGDSPPSRSAGAHIAASLTAGIGPSGPAGRRREDDVNLVTQALTGTFANGGADDNKAQAGFLIPAVSRALTTSNQRIDVETETFVLQDVRGLRDKKQHGIGVSEGDAPMYTLDGTSQRAVAFTQNQRDELRLVGGDGAIVGALAAEPGMKQQSYISESMSVRRLTPRECERLQGFPDDWTLLDDKTADSPRYRAAGNAVCVKVAEWLGVRIAEVDASI